MPHAQLSRLGSKRPSGAGPGQMQQPRHSSNPSFLFFQSRQSQRFRVSDHSAATRCYAAYFDQNFAERRVRDQANSHRSFVQHARRPENPSEEKAVRNAHHLKNGLCRSSSLRHPCKKPSMIN